VISGSKGFLRAERALPYLAWLIASCVSATLVHALIGIAGNLGESGGDAYARRAHGALGPVALAAVLLTGCALLASALRALSRPTATDPLLLLAKRFASRNPLLPLISVSLGCFLLLLGMEFSEQLCATGRIEGVTDALGGNGLAGSLAIAIVSAAVTWFGLRSARALVGGTIAAAVMFAAWILTKAAAPLDFASISRCSAYRRTTSVPALLARSAGLRAPPQLHV
jgi:hypothetical protein